MFAVPGWSLSPSSLKAQTAPIPSPSSTQPTQDGEAKPTRDKKDSRKRKREHKAVDVTAENVGELWKTVIEGRGNGGSDTKKEDKSNGRKEARNGGPTGKPNKRQRRQEAKAAREREAAGEPPAADAIMTATAHQGPGPSSSSSSPPSSSPAAAAAATPQAALPTSTTLTPLQSRMQSKLSSARFRHLNQTLYTTPSSSSLTLFTSTPDAYTAYHAGFRAQVGAWPENPVVGFIRDVEERWRGGGGLRDVNGFRRGKRKGGEAEGGGGGVPRPLPSGRDGRCRIVDLGCGDAALAASLRHLTAEATGAERKREKGRGGHAGGGKDGGKGVLEIRSVDLAKGDGPNKGLVTVGDSTDLRGLGIGDRSVDVAICCLSLMGTNWVGVVDECARITREGSEVWVAEIKSRFAKPKGSRKGGIGEKKKEKGGKKKKKKGDEEEEVEDEEMAALEEKKDANETDVSAFVEVWRKRGFALAADPEMGNKMFVKMRFVRLGRAGGGQEGMMSGQPRFTDQDGPGSGVVDESKTLKPCVYKTR